VGELFPKKLMLTSTPAFVSREQFCVRSALLRLLQYRGFRFCVNAVYTAAQTFPPGTKPMRLCVFASSSSAARPEARCLPRLRPEPRRR
jgi:hypothetical protein